MWAPRLEALDTDDPTCQKLPRHRDQAEASWNHFQRQDIGMLNDGKMYIRQKVAAKRQMYVKLVLYVELVCSS